ncbi:MAG: (2Fe-2S)-binding protein [Proteobacteria bacterium]|nr:(2Fe-2S)-binding protein [Pseudomonadota bacterium]
MAIEFTLNGAGVRLEIDARTRLLEALRNDLGLNGPKFGCGLAQCGACAVLLDGISIRSCVTPVAAIAGKSIVTLEGLGNAEHPHPLQAAFIKEQAIQCGYCANGVIITAAALLQSNPSPSEQDIRQALAGNLCRCGAQPRMLKAIAQAAEELSGDQS